MSTAIEDVLEIVTIEICVKKEKNIIMSCIYRAPSTNLDKFINHLEILLNNLSVTKKEIYVCGDYNVDLFKYRDHKATQEFVDMMFSKGLRPLITKPSRITQSSATLIDNIFTNDLCNDISSGLLINDISDHLPVFAVCIGKELIKTPNDPYRFVRIMDKDSVDSFKNELTKEVWTDVFDKVDASEAYSCFINRFAVLQILSS